MFKGGISLNDLNKNERRVLLALVEHPHLSITQISKKIWLSKPTVGKIKSKLLEKEYITPFVIPDLEKMMLGQYCVSFEFDRQSLQKLQLFEMKNKDDISIVKIFGGKEILFIIVAKNEDELEREIQRIKSSYNKEGFYPTFSVLNFSSSKKLLSIKKDFVSIIKPILFPEEF